MMRTAKARRFTGIAVPGPTADPLRAAQRLARGKRPEVIQRVRRHAKVSFTLDRYVKRYREDIRDAVQRSDQSPAAS